MKRIAYCLILVFLIAILITPVTATNQEQNISIINSSIIMPAIVSGGRITVNGTENELYPVYSSQHVALESIKEKIPNLLQILSNTYNLPPLSDSTWEQYRTAMFALFDSPERPSDYTEANAEYIELRSFFDIYENTAKNTEILEYVDLLSKGRTSNLEDLALMLPTSSPITQEYMQNKTPATRGSSIPFAEAIVYASNYAEGWNLNYYFFNSGDCANFVSQILENGNICSQVVTNSVYSGWWHKRTQATIGYEHTHSLSWTIADTFTKYMGIRYTTTNHSAFSASLSAGSIISVDFENDGDWDHVGFVTRVAYSTGNLGYYDYEVAQHSPGYILWTSDDYNGWETGSSKAYARVLY